MLESNGSISIVIPCDIMEEWKSAAAEHDLYPTRTTFIKTTPKKAPKRVLVEFRYNAQENAKKETLVLESTPGEYSNEAKEILSGFYLKL